MQICIPLFFVSRETLHCNGSSVNLYLCYGCKSSVVMFVITNVIQSKKNLPSSKIQLCRNVIKIGSRFYDHSRRIASIPVSISNKTGRIDTSEIVFCTITNKFTAVWKTNIITPDDITSIFAVVCNENPTRAQSCCKISCFKVSVYIIKDG